MKTFWFRYPSILGLFKESFFISSLIICVPYFDEKTAVVPRKFFEKLCKKPGRDDLCPALFLPVYEFLSRMHLIQHRKRCPSGNGELGGVHDRDTAAQQHLQRPDHTGVGGSTAGCHHGESLLMGL